MSRSPDSTKNDIFQDANFVAIGGTADGRYDNQTGHKWRQCWHNDDSWVLVMNNVLSVDEVFLQSCW